ncbi:hypothetical protein, partial [Tersicoccus phoenicis]|uniref:hypothetical protein n=1 Tax=Tersicoccus phoenicis TaxID=554083 RepID=UPI001C456365
RDRGGAHDSILCRDQRDRGTHAHQIGDPSTRPARRTCYEPVDSPNPDTQGLVDDPSSHPEQFPSVEAQDAERARLHALIEKLVLWENSNDETLLRQARDEIRKSNNGELPAVLDPFAGGGAIPLEAQRLGPVRQDGVRQQG